MGFLCWRKGVGCFFFGWVVFFFGWFYDGGGNIGVNFFEEVGKKFVVIFCFNDFGFGLCFGGVFGEVFGNILIIGVLFCFFFVLLFFGWSCS